MAKNDCRSYSKASSDHKEDSDVRNEIRRELTLLPPLMPLKFGNGLLLQYTVNMPGQDDHLYFLELGLAAGLTSLAMMLVNTLVSYLLLSAPSLFGLTKPERLQQLAGLARVVNHSVGLLQVGVMVFLFLYSVLHWGSVDFDDPVSEYYVKKRIYMFSLIVSAIMFVCSLLAGLVAILLWLHRPTQHTSNSSAAVLGSDIPPAASFLPLGLANAMLGLYIGIPGDDHSVVGPKVFLLDLCLVIGTVTVMLTVMQTIFRLALLVSLRDGRIDPDERSVVRVLHLSSYLMAGVQFVMFSLMLGHSLEVLMAGQEGDYLCPRNLLVVCLLLSGVLVGGGVTAIGLLAFLAL